MLASVGYSGRTDPAVLHARLAAAPRGATGDHGAAQVGDSRRASPWAADLYNRAEPAATTTPTQSASCPAPGCSSSGTAGKTTSPTNPPGTGHSSNSSSTTSSRRLDTGQLMRA
jgi:hypothetical protein